VWEEAAGNEKSYITQSSGRGGRMSAGCRRNAAVIGCLVLFSSLLFAGWDAQTSGVSTDLNSVSFPEGTEVGYAVGSEGVILKTTDGGGTWATQTSGTPSALYSVSFQNNSTGFAVGKSGTAIKTTDGGATWDTMSVGATNSLYAVQFVGTGGTGFAVSYDMAGGSTLYKTTDAGASWQSSALPGTGDQGNCLAFASESTGLVAGFRGYAVKTTDGGANFDYLSPGTVLDFHGVAFLHGSGSTAYVVGDSLTIWKTTDLGTTWVRMSVISPSDSGAALSSVCAPADPGYAYAVGSQGIIVKNFGTNWYQQTSGVTDRLASVCFPNGNDTGYVVGAYGVILKTTDGGGIAGVGGSERVARRTAVRIVSNPSRHGIALLADADANVVVFDAAGRAVMHRVAAKGMNFLSLGAGAYFLRAGEVTVRTVVAD
jgi:photosystem II stability/assembly factor-like uncharacterized protein